MERAVSLAGCHNLLCRLFADRIEPLSVMERADEHYRYWKPEKPRLILLGESHVYTEEAELCRALRLSSQGFANGLPAGFVRLVYCLGYGENKLLDEPIPRNRGTPQFWKIFLSCVTPIRSNHDFAPILISKTPFLQRVSNKVALLQTLKEQGIWLIDASIAALYPKPSQSLAEQALQISWDSHTQSIIADANPEAILCVGLGVATTLASRLKGIGTPWAAVPQPNARLSAAAHARIFETYYRLAHDLSYIKQIDERVWT